MKYQLTALTVLATLFLSGCASNTALNNNNSAVEDDFRVASKRIAQLPTRTLTKLNTGELFLIEAVLVEKPVEPSKRIWYFLSFKDGNSVINIDKLAKRNAGLPFDFDSNKTTAAGRELVVCKHPGETYQQCHKISKLIGMKFAGNAFASYSVVNSMNISADSISIDSGGWVGANGVINYEQMHAFLPSLQKQKELAKVYDREQQTAHSAKIKEWRDEEKRKEIEHAKEWAEMRRIAEEYREKYSTPAKEAEYAAGKARELQEAARPFKLVPKCVYITPPEPGVPASPFCRQESVPQ